MFIPFSGVLLLLCRLSSGQEGVEDTSPAGEPGESGPTGEVGPSSALGDNAEKHEFQAEVSRLMDIIINSLYTHKEVFLRELLSNSADALEKARYLSVQHTDYLGENRDLKIDVLYDDDMKTLSIVDTGVGMTKADLINNLGTVAKSGTTNFLETLAEGQTDTNLIGQFGVGFYSAFLVADRISVHSKNNDDPVQHIWESSADASFSIGEDPEGNTLGRGTKIVLHLKEDAHEYLEQFKLKDLIKKFSQFVPFPISLRIPKKEEKKEEDEDLDDEDEDEDETEKKEGEEGEEEGEKEEKKEEEKKIEWTYEQINTQKAIWLRPREDITEEEYFEFYKAVSHDWQEPSAYNHFSAEGEIEFKAILFIPKKAPYDMMDNYWNKKSEIKLYVRRVLVADKFDELLPRYLAFIKGVVDSDDLPLNVSREQLQQNKIMKVISKKLTRKALEMIRKLAEEEKAEEKSDEDGEEGEKKEEDEEGEKKEGDEDEEKKEGEDGEEKEEGEEDDDKDKKKKKKKEMSDFDTFYKEFGKNIKMGCYEDDSNRSKIAKMLRFKTTKHEDKHISLDQYLENMQEGQNHIYFISGDSIDVMKKHPSLQVFQKKDIEVLLLTDQLDEPCLQKLLDYEGKTFVSIQKTDIKLEETKEDKKKHSKIKKMYKPLTSWWKELVNKAEDSSLKSFGAKLESVTISKRLVDAPCVVVTSQFGYSAQQEKVMRAQAFQDRDQVDMMAGRKTLEINPNHPIIQDLLDKVQTDKEDETAADTALVLFQAAMLESGYDIQDPSNLVQKVYSLMSNALGVAEDAPIKEVEVPEDEEEVEEGEDKEDDDDDDEEGGAGMDMPNIEEMLKSKDFQEKMKEQMEKKGGEGEEDAGETEAETEDEGEEEGKDGKDEL